MRPVDVTFDDKFLLTNGRVFIMHVQIFLRVLMDLRRVDQTTGLQTA